MREERFRIQCPKHFLVGDSGRFEKSPQGKDSDFVVDYAPPEMFEAGRDCLTGDGDGGRYLLHNVCLFCTRGTPSGLYGQHEIRPTKSIHSENFC